MVASGYVQYINRFYENYTLFLPTGLFWHMILGILFTIDSKKPDFYTILCPSGSELTENLILESMYPLATMCVQSAQIPIMKIWLLPLVFYHVRLERTCMGSHSLPCALGAHYQMYPLATMCAQSAQIKNPYFHMKKWFSWKTPLVSMCWD